MGVQESHGVDEHLALKVRTIVSWPRSSCSILLVRLLDTLLRSGIRSTKGTTDLGSARIVGFLQLFFMHHPLQKAFERRAFQKIGFVKGVKAVLQSQGFFTSN